jgi:KaiC
MRSLAENQDVAGLHKMPTGVGGFDAITSGGLPRNRTSFILGSPGGGKTVFALQTPVMGRVISASRASSSPSKRTPATFWQTPQASGGTSLNWKGSNSSF